jgi:genome maintenance exonuclease 1
MTLTIKPPLWVERFDYQPCRQITDKVTGKRVYETPTGETLPSVTTILSATKDMTSLNEWRKRIGFEKAAEITKSAAGVGTAMHKNLERFMLGETRMPGNNLVHVKANSMADVIIQNAFSDVQEVWAMEQSLYYPGLFSGTTDLVCVYKDKPSICDFKQSNKLKKEEWVEDYKIQLIAYILAHNEVYKTDICEGHVFMCTQDLVYQQFDLLPKDFNKYQDMWLNKVEEYYKLKAAN